MPLPLTSAEFTALEAGLRQRARLLDAILADLYGPQLTLAMARVAAEGRGVVVYLRGHEGRGIGLGHKLRAYALQGCFYFLL